MPEDFTEPFVGSVSSRDMSTNTESNMSPTPVQPHLAHCCACNRAELEAAKMRQHNNFEQTRWEQGRSDFQIVIQVAERSLAELGDHKEAAEALLKSVFEQYTRPTGFAFQNFTLEK